MRDSHLRDWLRQASFEIVPELLCGVGCSRLSVEDIARRLGLAKGGLYFSQRDVAKAIAKTLDRWTDELACRPVFRDPTFAETCGALLDCVPLGDGRRPAIPCCLATSPCPHGWPARWQRIAQSLGYGGTDLALTLGDVLQAMASHPDVYRLIEQGRTADAVEVIVTAVGLDDDDDDGDID